MTTETRTQHTAEPWATTLLGYVVGPSGETLASVYGQTGLAGPELPGIANRERIVACVNACAGINPEAAPDLLAACVAAVDNYEEMFGAGTLYYAYNTPVDQLRAAIALAKGESK